MELLERAGLMLRGFERMDEAFIHTSWSDSGRMRFMDPKRMGDYQPFGHLAKQIEDARRANAVKLLGAMFDREIGAIIRRRGKTLVVCDARQPRLIAAWRAPEYRYTKQLFRRQGLQRILLNAAG